MPTVVMQPSKAATRSILCVVAALDVCDLVRVLLSEYEVVTVRTISEAKLWLERKTFELVISGDFLFDGTTVDLCEWVRANHPELPVIVLAGGRVPSSEIEEAGGSRMISYDAPSWPEELAKAVDQLAT